MIKKYIFALMLFLTLSFSFNVNSYASELASKAGNVIEDAATAGVDMAKDAVDKYFEENNIDVSHYKNRSWFEKIWDKIKAFFKDLFRYFVKDSKDELLATAEQELVKSANGLANDALDSIGRIAMDNLDLGSQVVLSDMIENGKQMTDEERMENIKQVGELFVDTASKVAPINASNSALSDGLNYAFDAASIFENIDGNKLIK